MKKTILLMLILIMAISSFHVSAKHNTFMDASPLNEMKTDSSENNTRTQAFAPNSFLIPVGKEQFDVGYLSDFEDNYGPESFAVIDGVLYIMDTVNRRILIISDKNTTAYSVDPCMHPIQFYIGNSRVYVSDEDLDMLFIYDKEWSFLKTIMLPDGLSSIDFYRFDGEDPDGNITILTCDMVYYTYDYAGEKWAKGYEVSVDNTSDEKCYSFDGKIFKFDSGKDTITRFLSVDFETNTICVIVYESVSGSDTFNINVSVRKYDSTGNLVGYSEIDTNACFCYPLHNTYVAADSTVYVMSCMADSVIIYPVSLNDESKLNTAKETQHQANNDQRIANPPLTSYTREQMNSRASAACTLSWILKEGNNTTSSPTVEIPPHIEHAHIGDSIQAIPYCRGGMVTSISDFLSKRDAGLTTGNIADNSYGNTGITTGLDCSGYVSYVLGFSVHHGTGTLIGEGYSGQSSLNALKCMDFLIRYNCSNKPNHAVLFDEIKANGDIWLFECTTNGQNRVVHHTRSAIYLEPFSHRTPYYCGHTGSCSPGSSYNSNSNYHWKICRYGCGEIFNYELHTFVPYGIRYKCSVCGKVVDQVPLIRSAKQET